MATISIPDGHPCRIAKFDRLQPGYALDLQEGDVVGRVSPEHFGRIGRATAIDLDGDAGRPSTTWLLVSTSPDGVMTMPVQPRRCPAVETERRA